MSKPSNSKLTSAKDFQDALYFSGLPELKSYGVWFTWVNSKEDIDIVKEKLNKSICNS